MAGRSKYKESQKVGNWSLVELLGTGGNAEVWRAIHDDGTEAALKILFSQNPNSEPYKRFKAEIELLRSLGSWPGVLPIIDASLPDRPERREPAWLAMPLAVPLRIALASAIGLPSVVEAIATIAETLASLAEKDISHRDIKPDNLYRYGDAWAVGDFGLASYPDKEALTEEGRKLGPLHFMAPEMLQNPATANGAMADVYSLAKTLWVLATGQEYPPPGEQRMDITQLNIGAYVSDPETIYLDRLIEHATKLEPTARPNMQQLAGELRAWLTPKLPRTSPGDLAAVLDRITILKERGNRTEEMRNDQIALAEDALRKVKIGLNPIAEHLAKAGLGVWTLDTRLVQYGVDSPYFIQHYGHKGLSLDECSLWRRHYGPGVYLTNRVIEGQTPDQMISKAGLILFEDGVFEMHSEYYFLLKKWPKGVPRFNWSKYYYAPIGSAEQERYIDSLINDLIENLGPSLDCLARLVEHSTD